ncbi:hypothetical protein BJX66DRAFT_319849 [Aspergillus keveii]|uniref:Uncharacterized protein n=1 Tax=Aspergillus keveii TaxID=714993 RepID=A0ABR4FHR8_9EURO
MLLVTLIALGYRLENVQPIICDDEPLPPFGVAALHNFSGGVLGLARAPMGCTCGVDLSPLPLEVFRAQPDAAKLSG